MNKKILLIVSILFAVLFFGVQPAFSQDPLLDGSQEPVEPSPLSDPPGSIVGFDTFFEIRDSEYLNISLESSVPVRLMMESIPNMIVMQIDSSEEFESATITLAGLESTTTYYKYEDDDINPQIITSDENGKFDFTQYLTEPHLIFIQSQPSTKYIPDDTDIGIWDEDTRTYTLTTDVSDDVWITQDNLVLLGNSHTISNAYIGIRLIERSKVTISGINISAKNFGIYQWRSNDNTISNNTITANGYDGIYLSTSSSNIITKNTITNNGRYGINFYNSSYNKIINNALSNNLNPYRGTGVNLSFSHNNELSCNVSENNKWGILVNRAHHNQLKGNKVSKNFSNGIYIHYSNFNTITRNTHQENMAGMHMIFSYYNQVYSNNFLNNTYQASDLSGGSNVFNLAAPIGGNHWSVWTSPDEDNDGFVDEPFQFNGSQDNLPWVEQFDWSSKAQSIPLVGSINTEFEFIGSNAYDPNGELNYEWDFGDGTSGSGASRSHIYYVPGIYSITLTVTDDIGCESSDTISVVVYDPSGDFVTGGGWIWSSQGTYQPDPTVAGWATFGFVAKYHKGAKVPDGQAELVYHTVGMNFHSTSYDWMVVTGSDHAKFKGSGTINGEGDYTFMIWASDGDPDTFRIKIWEEEGGIETVFYDNSIDRPQFETGQPIGKGSIVIRDPRNKPISAQCIADWEYHHTDTSATYILEVDRDTFEAYVLDIITWNRFDESLNVDIKSLSTGSKWSFTEPSCGTWCMYTFDFYSTDGIPLWEGTGTYKIEITQDEEGDVKLFCAD